MDKKWNTNITKLEKTHIAIKELIKDSPDHLLKGGQVIEEENPINKLYLTKGKL